MTLEPQAIRDRMEALEMTPDRERDLVTAAREICRVSERDKEGFATAFGNEVWRTTVLCRTHYARTVAVLPHHGVMAAAMLQGVTFAAAVLQPWLEDAEAAGDASMQAAFWRARAIALGADPGDFQRSLREEG